MMKKLVVVMMVVVMMMTAVTSTAMASTKSATVDSTRTAYGKVVSMYGADDSEALVEVTVKTNDGNYWSLVVDSNTDLRVYTKVKVVFKTMGTKTKHDDVIKSVKIR